MNAPSLLGVGAATPAYSLPQKETADAAMPCCAADARQERLLKRMYETTTVQRRASVLIEPVGGGTQADTTSLRAFYPPASRQPRGPTTAQRMAVFEHHAPRLAEAACRSALDSAETAPESVTHLVTVTCTGFVSPGVEHALIGQLGLGAGVARLQVGYMGCNAALNGFAAASAISRADAAAVVLVCCVELCSLHFQYGWDEQRLVSNALFADGAGAAVIGQSTGGKGRIAGAASRLIPGTEGEMTWAIGDHGFEMTLSPRVPGLIAEHLRPWLDGFLEGHGLDVGSVGGWCIHAGGPRIVSGVADRLGLDDAAIECSRRVLRDFGNMSSATVLFILERMREAALPRPWVMLAFGPGLVAEAILLT